MRKMMSVKLLSIAFLIVIVAKSNFVEAAGKYKGFEFLEPCSKNDVNIDSCILRSLNKLIESLRMKSPLLNYTDVEPMILDELKIKMYNTYQASFENIISYGVSAIKVTDLQSTINEEEVQLQLTMKIPKINVKSVYESSGELLFIKTNGAGKYQGTYEGVTVNVSMKTKPFVNDNGQKFLKLQDLIMDFSVRDIKMKVETQSYIFNWVVNPMINTQSQNLLTEMKPDLKKKFVGLMMTFVQKLLNAIPYDAFITD